MRQGDGAGDSGGPERITDDAVQAERIAVYRRGSRCMHINAHDLGIKCFIPSAWKRLDVFKIHVRPVPPDAVRIGRSGEARGDLQVRRHGRPCRLPDGSLSARDRSPRRQGLHRSRHRSEPDPQGRGRSSGACRAPSPDAWLFVRRSGPGACGRRTTFAAGSTTGSTAPANTHRGLRRALVPSRTPSDIISHNAYYVILIVGPWSIPVRLLGSCPNAEVRATH